MKIALIVNLFPPKWLAGTEVASYNIAKYLANKGHEVHVITSLDKGYPTIEIKDHFWIHRISFTKIQYIGFIKFWIFIYLEIKKINPDVIHVQDFTMAIPGLLSKIFLKKPYIVWGRGSDVYFPDKFTKPILKTVLKSTSKIIVLNEDMKTKINNIYRREDIVILSNGIELKKFKDTHRKQENIAKTIIFVGTLRPVKGVEYLIKAMNIIHEQLPDTNLLIVGDGPDREKLEKLSQELNLQNCIHFAGKVSNEEIPKHMAKADLFVLPSLSEGFPNVLLEAMASRLPIVTTNVGGLPNIIKDGENGLVVEPENPIKLANSILFLLKNKNIRDKISNNNIKYVEKFKWEVIIQKLEIIYQEIL